MMFVVMTLTYGQRIRVRVVSVSAAELCSDDHCTGLSIIDKCGRRQFRF